MWPGFTPGSEANYITAGTKQEPGKRALTHFNYYGNWQSPSINNVLFLFFSTYVDSHTRAV
jgi:hypothetical protein